MGTRPNTKQYKTAKLAECKVDSASRTIKGFASAFGVVDQQDDRVLPGAFAESLRIRPSVPLLWQHNTAEPIGKTTLLEERDYGLYFEASLTEGVQRADEALALAADQVVKTMSIGYWVKEWSWEESDKQSVRNLHKLDLVEVSPVTFAANEGAIIQSVTKGVQGSHVGIGALLSQMLQSVDNGLELRAAMMESAGIDAEAMLSIMLGEIMCPTLAVLEGLAEGSGIPLAALINAGKAAGCDYESMAEVPDELAEDDDEEKGAALDLSEASAVMADIKKTSAGLVTQLRRQRATSLSEWLAAAPTE
jgi:HK97 family phage prohead protease